ncbi:MAG: thiol reductant ABC exporter subunit CydD [Gammaproteobacteria bacterium]|nr:thiol reductant ABC exporter subunit CydD [Gammaproteobacteria bacterium]
MQAADWLRREARQLRRPLRTSAALTALQALLLVAQAWLLAGILDESLMRRAPLAALWRPWLGLLLLAPLRVLLLVRARRLAFDASQHLGSHLRAQLLKRIQALGVLGLRAQAGGDLITRLVEGVDALLPYFARYLPGAATAVLLPPLLAAFVLPADWISGLVLLLTAPLIPVFMVLVGGAAERASLKRFTQLRRLGSAFIDALGGLATLRQLGAAERVAAELETEGEEYRRLTMQLLRVAFLSALVLEFFAMVSIAVVAVLIGFRLLWHQLEFRDGMFVLLLAPEFYLPMRALGALRHARMDALAAARDMLVLEEAAPSSTPDRPGTAPGTQAAPRGAPSLRFEAVRFTHGGRREGLRGVDARIGPGVTALVGASGAGKSTLLDLVLRFAAPDSGRILVDETDLAHLDPASWRARIAWVPQQAHVFAGSLRDNLLLAAPAAGDALLARALRDSGLDLVAARLPRGLDTALGERGLGLSGGELQRLALARMLLRERATVWLLDEPTAHLDADGACTVNRLIRSAGATRTVLLVAHRLDAALDADQVLVLDDGRVVERGAPRALAAVGGPFGLLLAAEGR